ncbi:interaptin-like [Achroia grisella]|uniref:interaptin-like n=1 Tax=Achroia grisella TaxID=688607 RepID=UPI0027D26A30|nr:interaptin-like [Achroia grisella]
MRKSRLPSPSRSQGVLTPRRYKSRGTRSEGSPARSNTSDRLTSLIQFGDNNANSFVLSPINNRRSLLTDNTDIEEPKRRSWWKKLNENTTDIMEVMNTKTEELNNVVEEYIDVEVLSQEKKNYTLDLPESSDGESISSIVIPQRKLFTQKENHPHNKFGQLIESRESLAKLHKTNTNLEKSINVAPKNLFGQSSKQRNKIAFPAALLNISPNKTVNKTKAIAPAEEKGQVRNLFGNKAGTKRKNIFADFIMSDSEEEIPEIQPKVFGFQRKCDQMPHRRRSSASNGIREHSPTSSITTDIEMDDWKLLPSSTMVENQLEDMMASGKTPVKRAKLSKLSEVKESEIRSNISIATCNTDDKTSQSNKSNKSKQQNITEKQMNMSSKSNKSKSTISSNAVVEEPQNESRLNKTMDIQLNHSVTLRSKSISGDIVDQSINKSKNMSNSIHKGGRKELSNSKNVGNDDKEKAVNININEQSNKSHQYEAIPVKVVLQDDENMETSTCSRPNMTILEKSNLNICINNKTNTIINDSQKHTSHNENVMLSKSRRVNRVINETETDLSKPSDLSEHSNQNENRNVNKESSHIRISTAEPLLGSHDEVINDELENLGNKSRNKVNEVLVTSTNDASNNNENGTKSCETMEVNTANNQEIECNDQSDKGHSENNSQLENVEDNKNVSNNTDAEEFEDEIEIQDRNESLESLDQNQKDGENESILQKSLNIIDNNEEVDDEDELENNSDENQEEEQDSEETDNESDINNRSNSTREESRKETENESEAEDNTNEIQNENQSNKEMDNESEAENEQDIDNDDNSESSENNQHEELEMDNENEVEDEIEEIQEENEDDSDQKLQYESDEDQNDTHDEVMHSEEEEELNNELVLAKDTEHETPEGHDRTEINQTRLERKQNSPEAILSNKTNQIDSFTVQGRNTSVRMTKSMIRPLNIKPSLAPVRESTGISDGTRNSSAEGSGWDSHRTTRKTLRQTFGRDFTPRKSLRALVMEKSAKRHTVLNDENVDTNVPIGDTELTELSNHECNDNEAEYESTHEISKRTRQTTLEMYLQKIKKQNMEKKKKMEEAVKNSLKAPTKEINLFKVPARPNFMSRRAAIKTVQNKNKPKNKLFKATMIPLDDLPSELLEDMKYKPPPRFQPRNASWITKRLYKFLETKLEPKYDYKTRLRSEKLVETLYNFTKDVRRHPVAPNDAVELLKHEMARLDVVKTHFEFYQFFHDYMPREIRVKVNPDVVNGIPLPRHGVFANIL